MKRGASSNFFVCSCFALFCTLSWPCAVSVGLMYGCNIPWRQVTVEPQLNLRPVFHIERTIYFYGLKVSVIWGDLFAAASKAKQKAKFICVETLSFLTNNCYSRSSRFLSSRPAPDQHSCFLTGQKVGEWQAWHWPWAAPASTQVWALGGGCRARERAQTHRRFSMFLTSGCYFWPVVMNQTVVGLFVA